MIPSVQPRFRTSALRRSLSRNITTVSGIGYPVIGSKQRPYGIDTSHWDGGFDITKCTIPLDFMYTKATEGNYYTDSLLNEIWFGGMKDVPVRGLFHYFKSEVDWKMQMDYFASVAKKYEIHFVVLDVEPYGNVLDGKFLGDVRRSLEYMDFLFPYQKILLYTNKDILQNYLYPYWMQVFPDGKLALDSRDLAYAQYYLLSSPDNNPSMAKQRDPNNWTIYQYTESGDGKANGTDSIGVDLDVFNGSVQNLHDWAGSVVVVQPPADEITHPFEGVTRITGERFGRKFYLNICEPSKIDIEVKTINGGVQFPSAVCRILGAQLAFNGDDWNRTTMMVVDNNTPSLMIFPDKSVTIGNKYVTTGWKYHSSGQRYIVQDKIPNSYLDDTTKIQYTERHARSINGIDGNGNFMHLTVDGEYIVNSDGTITLKGVTLKEAALIMCEFDCVTAFDGGGGGDSVDIMSGIIMNEPANTANHYERKIPQTILVYAKESDMTTANGLAKEALGKTPTVRSSPEAVSGNDVATLSPYVTIEFTEIAPDSSISGRTWLHIVSPNGYVIFEDNNHADYWTILSMPVDNPPPSNGSPATIDMVLTSGSTVIIKDKDGNIVYSGTTE